MATITDIRAHEIPDSRGRATLEVSVYAGEAVGVFSVPSGASTGSAEAHELRDEDGSMKTALERVLEVREALLGMDVTAQREIDERMCVLDGTVHKERLGGNVTIGVSIACAKAAAVSVGIELYAYLQTLENITPSRTVPYLYFNYINGGLHAKSPLAFQEHIIVPETESVTEGIAIAEDINRTLALCITARYGLEAGNSMGDEGGYVIHDSNYLAPFELLTQAIADAGHTGKVKLAIDVAASSFYSDGTYRIGEKDYTPAELSAIYKELSGMYPLRSIEDPFAEDSFADFSSLQSSIDTVLVGDDLTTTNVARLQKAIEGRCVHALIIKPNQIGTLTETLDTMKLARSNAIDCIVSHRSGETMDDFVADLAYAFGAYGLKAGSLRRPERRIKYERLAHISHT